MIYMWLESGVIIMAFLLALAGGLTRHLAPSVIDRTGMPDDPNSNPSRVKKY